MHKLKGGEKTRKKQFTEESPERCPQCDQILPSSEPIRLEEWEGWHGLLTDISQPDQEGFALACFGGAQVEVPASFAEELWERELVGQRVWLALVKGRMRAGRMSACTQ